MKKLPLLGKLVTTALVALGSLQAAELPNIVFLLSDDQSWGDYGFMGHPHIQTPHIDSLAKSGLLYERGYVTAPLCRPSLASIFTGKYPHETGIRGNDPVLPGGKNRNNARKLWMEKGAQMTAPIGEQPSFIKSLQKSGYATLQTGKWWEGNPLDHGFTSAMTHGDPTRGGRHGDKGLDIGRKTMKPIYDFVADAKAKEQPFFIWYGVYLPHAPHNAPDRLYKKYQDLAPNEPTARYWANVEWLDEGCGQIIDHLKEQGLYENTIFIFTCDNGWVQDPERKNQSIRSKRDPVEAGIRTPIIISQEGTITPQRNTTALASNIDIAPTILKACGIEVPAAMSGLDLREPKLLEERDRVFVDVYDHDTDIDQLDDLNNGLVAHIVIDGWDKLIARPEANEYYDLKTDPDDRTDLSSEHPEKVTQLSAMLADWLKSTPPFPIQ